MGGQLLPQRSPVGLPTCSSFTMPRRCTASRLRLIDMAVVSFNGEGQLS